MIYGGVGRSVIAIGILFLTGRMTAYPYSVSTVFSIPSSATPSSSISAA
jgi:hypothetical protein